MATERRAYKEGFEARLRGERPETNPYFMMSGASEEEWRAWIMGWNDQDKHLNDRDEVLWTLSTNLREPP